MGDGRSLDRNFISGALDAQQYHLWIQDNLQLLESIILKAIFTVRHFFFSLNVLFPQSICHQYE